MSGAAPSHPREEIRLGISACILGEEVRYNGGHKLDRFIRDTLGSFVTFVPVCPEVSIDLGVPRNTLRLVRGPGDRNRLVMPKTGADHTAAMSTFAKAKVRELDELDLCGFIVQKGSPSCGMERVKVYGEVSGGAAQRNGRGLFTAILMDELPLLPVEEDGRLNDPVLRENFIERVFAYRRLRDLFGGRWKLGDLVSFHASEKLLLLAHDPVAYRELGRMVASGKSVPRGELRDRYSELFLRGLAKKSTLKKHVNVLQHIAGYFKKNLDPSDKDEIHDLIAAYRNGHIPLIVPITILKHHARRQSIDYLQGQSYLEPHPRELMLRNHV